MIWSALALAATPELAGCDRSREDGRWDCPAGVVLRAGTTGEPSFGTGTKAKRRGTAPVRVLDADGDGALFALVLPDGVRASGLAWQDEVGWFTCATPGDAAAVCPSLLDAVARTTLSPAPVGGPPPPEGCGPQGRHAVACPDGTWLDWASLEEGDPARHLDLCASEARIAAEGPVEQRRVACAVLGEAGTCLRLEVAGTVRIFAAPTTADGPACLSCGGARDPFAARACANALRSAP